MKPNRKVIAGFFVVACLVFALTAASSTAVQNTAPAENEIFHDKVVTVYLDDPRSGSGQVLKEAKLQKIGDRWFLVGKAVYTGQAGEWDDGLTSGVSWDDVTAFYIFTEEQFAEKMTDPRS